MADKTLRKKNESATSDNVSATSFIPAKDAPIIALAGNPNVGKSTVFNYLTGMNQHTGNWPGKTVANAQGKHQHRDIEFSIVDLPGTYSLLANSAEEEIARDFICFGHPSAVVVVCDATCLERNLNLALQIREITDKVVLCVNLLDEAAKKKIHVDLDALSRLLDVPVVGASAREGKGLWELMEAVYTLVSGGLPDGESAGAAPSAAEAGGPMTCPGRCRGCAASIFRGGYTSVKTAVSAVPDKKERHQPASPSGAQPPSRQLSYPAPIEEAIRELKPYLEDVNLPAHWLGLQLLNSDSSLLASLEANKALSLDRLPLLRERLAVIREGLDQHGYNENKIKDAIAAAIVSQAESVAQAVLSCDHEDYNRRDRLLDRILTGRYTGFPVMLLLLALVFWLTITGANYPSAMLASFLFSLEAPLHSLLAAIGLPETICLLFSEGMYRTLAWVISVMLPPMAIFFPLFTLLEDSGYLPRVAFNLDSYFKRSRACGKQALTMCMGFGCNAAGVIGCRIIDSPRERLIAILTNNFVPCNGRFPTLIAIITMFFVAGSGLLGSASLALLLTGLIVLGILMTFWTSGLLSKTVLKGVPSSFALELPPYRRPQIGQVIVRSVFDRTLFVLGRAVVAAAPAGLIIWLLANTTAGEMTLLARLTGWLEPFGHLIGMDGVILMAFILGFPANEIVVPIMIMAYLAGGGLVEFDDLHQLRTLLVSNGWTWVTALCVMLFSLFHFPCATTCLTIRKETGSLKWTALAFCMPTVIGIAVCAVIASLARLIF